MRRIKLWIGVAMSCGVAFAQKPEAGNVFVLSDGGMTIHAGPAGRMAVATLGVLGPVVKGAPYTADVITEMTQVLADGTHINRQQSYTIYRDGEGRIRRDNGEESWISDPVASVSYVLNNRDQTARRMPVSQSISHDQIMTAKLKAEAAAGGLTFAKQPGMVLSITGGAATFAKHTEQAPKLESLGKQEMEGVQVEGTRTTMTIPEGEIGNDRPIQIVSERWESPELHVTVLSKHLDPMAGDRVEKLTAIRRGEPAQSLFEVPAGYQVQDAK
ncbi:MAG: hypothetical protein U0Q18_21585 [Bryobacteraceae bacterium]